MQADYGLDYTSAQDRRSRLRKLVRRIYLRRACQLVTGPTLDFGCGVGELLARLPAGSAGIEYNHASVSLCRSRGLPVHWYNGEADGWRLTRFRWGFRSMVLSHVLEHFSEPMTILGNLLDAAVDSGIERVLVIVPGRAGFRRDATHRTFVDLAMLRNEVAQHAGWREAVSSYFPLRFEGAGKWFVYNELHFVVERIPVPASGENPTLSLEQVP